MAVRRWERGRGMLGEQAQKETYDDPKDEGTQLLSARG
jgi:hypothetical protein